MADSKHTPGPWEYREIAPYDDGIGYISADGHDIIHAGVSDLHADENRANSRLIAAAPDLLAMLKVAQLWLDVDGRFDMQGINAAIAKAEGRS